MRAVEQLVGKFLAVGGKSVETWLAVCLVLSLEICCEYGGEMVVEGERGVGMGRYIRG